VRVKESLVATADIADGDVIVGRVAHALCLQVDFPDVHQGDQLLHEQVPTTTGSPLVCVMHPLSPAAVANDYHGFAEGPNAAFQQQVHNDVYNLVACKPISSGEQIVIDYGEQYQWDPELYREDATIYQGVEYTPTIAVRGKEFM